MSEALNVNPKVELRGLTKEYGGRHVVKQLTVAANEGEFLSLLGPSGCGKTTTLRMIAGFVEPSSGSIAIDGEEISRRPVHRRGVGLVFQNYALFPHLTVFENVAFGLRRRRTPRAEVRQRAIGMLETVELSHLADRFPAQLSGGEQQRVALARVLVLEPRLILLDEPFSNLDARLRRSMRSELRLLQQQLKFTALFVTHDQEEAMALSDRIAVMHAGELLQIGTPSEIYHAPASPRVAGFIGRANLLHATVRRRFDGRTEAESGGIRIDSATVAADAADEDRVIAMLRPERLRLSGQSSEPSQANTAAGVVRHMEYLGGRCLLTVEVDAAGTELLVETGTAGLEEEAVSEGARVVLTWDADAVRMLKPDESVASRVGGDRAAGEAFGAH